MDVRPERGWTGSRPARGRALCAWIAFGAATVLLAAPADATAGTYGVLACDAAPGAVNNSWREHEDRGMRAGASCPTRGDPHRGLAVRNLANAGMVRPGKGATLTFRAPRGASLAGIELDWDGRRVNGEWRLGLVRADGRLIAGCPARLGSRATCRVGDPKGAALLRRGLGGTPAVRIEARCADRAGCLTEARRRPGDRTRARLAAHRATVHVADTSAPNVAAAGELLSGRWLRGRVATLLRASDNVGIRATTLRTGRVTRAVEAERCDFTRPVPCPGRTQVTHELDTALLPDGRHPVSLTAIDSAGNTRAVDRIVSVDNHAPARVSGVRVLGRDGVRSTNSFDLRWSPPPRQAAPIVRAHYRLCRHSAPAHCLAGVRSGGAHGLDDLSVPGRGNWRFQVWLEDAAGNVAPASASEPVTLSFDDRTPARVDAGFPRSGGSPTGKTTVRFGGRPVVQGTVAGVNGARIGRVPLTVLTTVRGSDHVRRAGATFTDAGGHYRFRLPAGPSRRVTVAFGGNDRYRPASGTARLAVRAKSSLTVNRRRVRNGDRVRFNGRLLGGPIPRNGKLLQLEAFYRERWRTFAVVRTDARGGWHRSYRFEATRGRVRYPFRVRVPRERTYPYAVGRSRVVPVIVNGR